MGSPSLTWLTAAELARRMRFSDGEIPRLEACFVVMEERGRQWLRFESDVIVLEGAPLDVDEPPSCIAEDMAIHVEANLKEIRGRFGVVLPWRSLPS